MAFDAYCIHTHAGSVTISPPVSEARIAAIAAAGRTVRSGARGGASMVFLLDFAKQQGANTVRQRVEDVIWSGEWPHVVAGGNVFPRYDLVVVAAGVNNDARRLLEKLDHGTSRRAR